MNINSLDIGALKLLDAMLKHRSVSNAAHALDIPQSTASRILGQLRSALNDELFVRSGGRMHPTPAAIRCAAIVSDMLALSKQLQAAGSVFEAEQSDRNFVVAGSDVGQLVIFSTLWPHIQNASKVSLTCVAVPGDELSDWLGSGKADLAFGAFPRLQGGIKQQTVYYEYYRCFCNPDHPYVKSPTLEMFLASEHCVTSTASLAHVHRRVERKLYDLIPAEKIRLVAGTFLVALAGLKTGQHLLTAPGRVLEDLASELGLVSMPLPMQIDGFAVNQYWHTRFSEDPTHRWLRLSLFQAASRRWGGAQNDGRGNKQGGKHSYE